MRYRLNKQGYGTLMDESPVLVGDELACEVEVDGATVKLVTGAKGSPFYAAVRDGVCRFAKETLVGDVGVSIITNQGVIPCTSLVAVETKGGVMLIPDARETLKRLERAERDISDCVRMYTELQEKYENLEERLRRLFVGYDL